MSLAVRLRLVLGTIKYSPSCRLLNFKTFLHYHRLFESLCLSVGLLAIFFQRFAVPPGFSWGSLHRQQRLTLPVVVLGPTLSRQTGQTGDPMLALGL